MVQTKHEANMTITWKTQTIGTMDIKIPILTNPTTIPAGTPLKRWEKVDMPKPDPKAKRGKHN